MPILQPPEPAESDGGSTDPRPATVRVRSGFRREYEALKCCFRHEGDEDLKDLLRRNKEALKAAFRWTPGNSDAEKVATWIGLFCVGLITVGIMFGWVVIDTGPKQYVWEAIKLVVVAMLARIQAKESERLKEEADEGYQ